jgi:hypothetical protein
MKIRNKSKDSKIPITNNKFNKFQETSKIS